MVYKNHDAESILIDYDDIIKMLEKFVILFNPNKLLQITINNTCNSEKTDEKTIGQNNDGEEDEMKQSKKPTKKRDKTEKKIEPKDKSRSPTKKKSTIVSISSKKSSEIDDAEVYEYRNVETEPQKALVNNKIDKGDNSKVVNTEVNKEEAEKLETQETKSPPIKKERYVPPKRVKRSII